MRQKRFSFQNFFLLFAATFLYTNVNAQNLSKTATDAFTITRMVQKFHVQPRILNDTFSSDFFNRALQLLDDEKIFFTQQDILKLSSYEHLLDEQVMQKKTDFLQLLINIYNIRISEADTMIDNICKTPFSFSQHDIFTLKEDTTFPANEAAMHTKFYKLIKFSLLNSLSKSSEKISALNSAAQKKYLDSVEVVLRKKVAVHFKRFVNIMKESPGGLQQAVCDVYCKSLASCYDPHTEYFPLTEKENFESELGNGNYEFGFSTEESDGGGVLIKDLKPGSAAFKSGLLNEGDRIISLQWENKEMIDVSDASENEVAAILSASNHDKITITIVKADGTKREVSLTKQKTEESDDDNNKVKSFLLKGNKTVGYISLPAFYEDWEDADKDVKGCANDVATEIVKLKKENIGGLILDLRYNGGGSVEEAIELAGIFIDAGPVAQTKGTDAKIYTLKDVNRGTIYDGPLLILVNGYSASASELLAGTLQDYNRAIIAGNNTYGKATAQVVFPLDTTVTFETIGNYKNASGYIKITTDRIYRISGQTAQGAGVQPDITIPDISENEQEHENDDSLYLHVQPIDANKYFKPYTPIALDELKDIAAKNFEENGYFTKVKNYKIAFDENKTPKDISLQWDDFLKEKKNKPAILNDTTLQKDNSIKNFSIENNSYEKERLLADESLRETNEQLKDFLLHDYDIKIAYSILSAMIK